MKLTQKLTLSTLTFYETRSLIKWKRDWWKKGGKYIYSSGGFEGECSEGMSGYRNKGAQIFCFVPGPEYPSYATGPKKKLFLYISFK